MKRHPALIPLSHDHHHALVAARRLARSADEEPDTRREAAGAFLDFFAKETARHFREEEAELFPLVALYVEPALDLLAQACVEHARLRGLAGRLRSAADAGEIPPELPRELGELLSRHVRLEERELFPLAERSIPPAALAALPLDRT